MYLYTIQAKEIQKLLDKFSKAVYSENLIRLPYNVYSELAKITKEVNLYWSPLEFIAFSFDNKDIIIGKNSQGTDFYKLVLNDFLDQERRNNFKKAIINTYTEKYHIPILSEECSVNKNSEYPVSFNNITNSNNNNNDKENKDMNLFNNINLDCGPVNSDKIQTSPYGPAIKASDGWKAYDAENNCIVSVDGFTFDFGKTPLFYKMPVSPNMISIGDLIIHNNKCFYVQGFKDVNDANSGIYVIDIASNEEKTILPSKNIFNFNFIIKVISMLDFSGGNTIFGSMKPSKENPFGGYMQMMLLSEIMNGSSGDFDFGKMLMFQSICGGGLNLPFGNNS